MMTFKDLIHNYVLKNEASSIIKIYQVLCSIGLNIVRIFLRDGPFSSDIGTFNFHLSERIHCIGYLNETFLIVSIVLSSMTF